MKQCIAIFFALVLLCLSSTTAIALPVEIMSSSYSVSGEWQAKAYEYDESGFNRQAVETANETFEYHSTSDVFDITIKSSSYWNYQSGPFPYLTSSVHLDKFVFDHHANTGDKSDWPLSNGLEGGDGRIDTYIEASWMFRPADTFLHAEMEYVFDSTYFGDGIEENKPVLEIALVDLTTSEYLLAPLLLPQSFRILPPSYVTYSFNVNPAHDYAFTIYGKSLMWDNDDVSVKLTAEFRVPEPVTMHTLGICLIGLLVVSRKMFKKRLLLDCNHYK